MRTTDFCFPLLRLRVPVPRVLPASLRDLRLALGRRACTRDQETGGPGISRCPIRFGGLPRVGARLVSSGAPDRAVPVTPPSLPTVLRRAFTRRARARSPRPLCPPLRELGRNRRPEVPSFARRHPRTCVDRFRSRMRSRDVFRYGPKLGAPSTTTPRTPLSRRTWLPQTRPPSPRIVTSYGFHARRRHALLWVRLPPNDFCN